MDQEGWKRSTCHQLRTVLNKTEAHSAGSWVCYRRRKSFQITLICALILELLTATVRGGVGGSGRRGRRRARRRRRRIFYRRGRRPPCRGRRGLCGGRRAW